jgi:uncharacterized membrane protein
MAEYHAAITVNAPLHPVYTLFTHFHDFPKFMSMVVPKVKTVFGQK